MSATPHRILCATDFSHTGERAQQMAAALARRFAAELHLLYVQVLLDDPHLAEERRDEIQRLLATADGERRLALEAAASGHTDPMHCHVVPAWSAADGIVTTCTDLGCDLIVIGTHGRRGRVPGEVMGDQDARGPILGNRCVQAHGQHRDGGGAHHSLGD